MHQRPWLLNLFTNTQLSGYPRHLDVLTDGRPKGGQRLTKEISTRMDDGPINSF